MRFGYIYLLSGLLGLTFACLSRPLSLVLLFSWVAVSFLSVSAAYFLNNPAIFRKKSDGRIPLFIKIFFIPFLVIIHAYNKLARDFDEVPSIQSVGDKLFIGDRLTPGDIAVLRDNEIKAVLDVTAEFESLYWSLLDEKICYLNIPVLDHAVPSKEQLQQAVIWIQNQQTLHGSVLVNCALGRGRSALVIAAYLLSQASDREIPKVLAGLKDIRRTVNLNKRQQKFLSQSIQNNELQSFPRAWVIANPAAGGGKWKEYRDDIVEKLSPHYLLKIQETSEHDTESSLIDLAAEKAPDAVIACGGDGTVSEVASRIVDTDITLGIVPCGTTNALCHVLMGVKSKLMPIDTACSYIVGGKARRIDTATCNGRLVLLLVGLGFEQKMMEAADRQAKDDLGQFAYLHGLWQAVQNNEIIKVKMTVDDADPIFIETSSLVIANAAPLTTILAQGKGAPDHMDGLLDVTWIDAEQGRNSSIIGLLELAMSGVLNVNSEYSIKHLHAKHITLSTEPENPYVIDGEVFQPEELEIHVLPESLRVFC